jgi:BRO1-like domain
MISIPKKSTEDVDWTTPIRNLIAQSYGESPDNYASECATLQRCRQDAVKGAGSDFTGSYMKPYSEGLINSIGLIARDLLYKYFGQLELLELRFSEIRVTFPWHDAFTNKLVTQTSIAYEKASILFQIASTHSAIASSQSRSDPEGLKRAFHYFRTCAGMLYYINENFLHAPSTDLSRDVIKFLSNVILAQATEVFFEKCTDEKKGNALVSKVGAQAASMYTTLCEEVKEFMGKGIFDRNWVTLLQVRLLSQDSFIFH